MNGEQVTVYGGVGLAFQDAVAAWQIFRAALSPGLGCEIEFLA
jgi:ornithine cyclodeaminase/alanine dehydrogenase-like protein (mu-crystallin family)